MRRFSSRPYGQSVRPSRLVSMLFAVAILWMLYERFRDPSTWRSLLDLKDDTTVAAAVEPAPIAEDPEVIVPGPNDLDDEEVARSKERLDLVTDKTPLKPREMHAYWQFMQWSQTESSAELEKRALHDVAFTQLWEQPEKYRGELISMRLHVRRILKYEAPSNPGELRDVYEAWGWTDESRSFPYVVVFAQCPDGLPIGTDIRGEVNFVGYFLKIMKYDAFDVVRGAPLLVGRVQLASPRIAPRKAPPDTTVIMWILGGASVLAGYGVWRQFRAKSANKLTSLPDDVVSLGEPSSSRRDNLDVIPEFSDFEEVGATSHEEHR
jgi:hypothetical protein